MGGRARWRESRGGAGEAWSRMLRRGHDAVPIPSRWCYPVGVWSSLISLLLGCTSPITPKTVIPGADSGDSTPVDSLPTDSSPPTCAPDDTGTPGTDDSGTTPSDSGSDSGTTGADSGTTKDSASTDSGTATRPEPTGPIVIYAVRHAEKESEGDDPGLTEEGTARAEALAVLLADAPLSAVYATDLRRTQDTVRPTADDHGLPIQIDYDPETELAWHILEACADQTVLHAGHSYTLEDFFEALGLDPVPDVDDYGQLWTIHLSPGADPTVEESRFGD